MRLYQGVVLVVMMVMMMVVSGGGASDHRDTSGGVDSELMMVIIAMQQAKPISNACLEGVVGVGNNIAGGQSQEENHSLRLPASSAQFITTSKTHCNINVLPRIRTNSNPKACFMFADPQYKSNPTPTRRQGTGALFLGKSRRATRSNMSPLKHIRSR